jgi:hypothetical protein
LPKETNQRKGSRSLGPAFYAGLPCAAHKSRLLENVALLVQVAFLLFIPLLGCVKWHFENRACVFVF